MWLVVKALAFRALVWNDEIELRGKELALESTRRRAVVELRTSKVPFRSCFVDRSVRTFRFTCAAIDTVTGDIDRHRGDSQIVERSATKLANSTTSQSHA